MRPERVLASILAGNRNIRFGDLLRLAEALGFRLKRVRGSHHILDHPTAKRALNLQPDRNGQAKGYQIGQLLDIVRDCRLRIER
jgi:predicted RNA binding protein YcfA (HicA-like mRNA interferase family)